MGAGLSRPIIRHTAFPRDAIMSQSLPNSARQLARRNSSMIALVVMGLATTGYFIGLSAPMTDESAEPSSMSGIIQQQSGSATGRAEADEILPATAYAAIGPALRRARGQRPVRLADLAQRPVDPHEKIEVSSEQRDAARATRAQRRSYDGAPPTIPHRIDQLSAKVCMACHENGLRSRTVRATRMPHPYYANCTQCHVSRHADVLSFSAEFENEFAGVVAAGETHRANWQAPPVIPHTTWMRQDCNSCHGHTGPTGLKTTHPWRTSCTKCHAESTLLNLTPLHTEPGFLPPLEVLDVDP